MPDAHPGLPPAQPPIPDAEAALVTCRYCETTGAARTEWRTRLVARPFGTWSLSGQQIKSSATVAWWPWMVCRIDLGGCGHASEGYRE